jgi:NADH-quinone oxidoreductase subunit N
MLAYSAVAQAGYMLAGVVVATELGIRATVFYLAVYLFMNMAAFAVILARERETGEGDSVRALAGLGRERPYLAWPMTLAMLGLAGIPATAGFMGKFYLIDAAVAGGYTWLGIVIVIGSMISLGYYLPVIAAMWMGRPTSPQEDDAHSAGAGPFPVDPLPAIAGGSQELDVADSGAAAARDSDGAEAGDSDGAAAGDSGATAADDGARSNPVQLEVVLVAVLAGGATLFFGIVPQPLFDLVQHAGRGFGLF